MFRLDVPNVMLDSVDEQKLTSETSCRRERVIGGVQGKHWLVISGVEVSIERNSYPSAPSLSPPLHQLWVHLQTSPLQEFGIERRRNFLSVC